MLTATIIKGSTASPLHIRPASALQDEWVSSRSQWKSPRWLLDTNGHGDRGYAVINWDIPLGGGRSLLDPEFAGLLDWIRRFVWTLYAVPGRKAHRMKPSSSSHIGTGLGIFVPWLVEQNIYWPHEITRSALEHYWEDLPALIVAKRERNGSSQKEISGGTAYACVSIVFRLWQQGAVLAQAEIKPMPEHPSENLETCNAIAKRIANEERGWIQPLPDEVAIPLLNRAAWFLGGPADDLLNLRDQMELAYNAVAIDKIGEIRQRKVCYAWDFMTVAEDSEPWHPKLTSYPSRGPQRMLQLMKHLQAAAMISLQAFTGMRVSELCGLPMGMNLETGLPSAVEMRVSASGLNEVFTIRTELTKTEEVPRDVVWYLGMRPLGSNSLPLPVRALMVLNRLGEPYRDLIESDRLLLSLRASRGLPKSSKGVAKMKRETVLQLYKDFVGNWVDLTGLPDESRHRTSEGDLIEWRESKGRIIKTHQLRKTFALYVLAVEPRLLPAVKRQFQHVSLAMTEGGYWGRNPLQIESLHSVSSQQTALLMYELATGRTRVAGKGGSRFTRGAEELRDLIDGMDVEHGWRTSVKWVRRMDIESVIAQHGACAPLSASEMECWKKIGLRPLGHTQPNYDVREPGLCAGCAAFWMDARHIPTWEERFIENEIAFRRGEALGQAASFRRVKERARQARNLLTYIGHNLAVAEERIRAGLEGHASRS